MKTQQVSDRALIEEFRTGSLDAYEQLLRRYESKVYNLALKFTRNPEDAEEVLQDVFVTLYQKIKGFEGKSAFSSWLYRIVVNASFMKLRKRKQNPAVSIEDLTPMMRSQFLDWPDHQPAVRSDSITINNELRSIVESAITRLPDEYRAVFVLRDVDGLSNQEVSEILDISLPAIKSRLHRARIMLRRKLLGYYRLYRGHNSLRDEMAMAQGAS